MHCDGTKICNNISMIIREFAIQSDEKIDMTFAIV